MLSNEEVSRIQETEAVRAEIRKLLEPPKTPAAKTNWIGRFFGHEAGRLVLGFVLTTAVGSWLAYWWKEKELANQEETAALKARLEAQTLLVQDLTKTVSATLTACHDVLSVYFYGKRPTEEIKTVRANYFIESAKWRTDSKVIRVRLAVYFKDPAIHTTFTQVIKKRRHLGVTLMRILSGNVKTEAELETEKKYGLTLANDIESLLVNCGSLMAAEMEGRSSVPSPSPMGTPSSPALQSPDMDRLPSASPR